MFEIVDGWTDDDGRTPEHGYTISSPCEPNGSGELTIAEFANSVDHNEPSHPDLRCLPSSV